MLLIPPSLKWAGYTAIALHVLRKATHRFHTHFSFPQDIPCGICILDDNFEPIRLFGVRNKAIAEKMKRAIQQAGFYAMVTDNAILDGTEDASARLGLLGAMNHYAADAIMYPGNWSSAYGKDIQSHPKGKAILHALSGFRIMPFVERVD